MMDTSAAQEHEIIHRARVGDSESFNRLVYLYREKVIWVAYRMCGDRYLAEDAAQIAFLKAWQHLSQLKPGSSFRNWLYRIAINAAIDILRREKPQESLESLSLGSADASPVLRLEDQERIARVRQAILELPEASRSVLILKEYEYFSYREIADILDIPIGTVMSRLNYARRALAKRLHGEMEVE